MSKIESNKIYNSSQITENGDKWTDFENFQGSEVELFLKDKLEDSVVEFKYWNTGFITPDTNETLNNVLEGRNAFGRTVCYERVINADPTYTADFEFQRVTVGTSQYNVGEGKLDIQVNKSDNLVATATFKYLLTGNIAGSIYNETSAQSITFKWFKDVQGLDVDATLDTLSRTVTPGESVTVDVTRMFESSFSKRYLGVVFTVPNGKAEIIKVFDQPFTLRKLDLSYKGNAVLKNNSATNECIITNINLDGVGSDSLADYKLEYYLDNVTKLSTQLDNTMTVSNIQLKLANLSEGAHDLFVRAVSSGNLTSNYIQISFIYQKTEGSVLTNAVAMVSEVPNEINNCNLSKFFKVVTTANISGHVEIVALKSSTPGNIIGISTIADAKLERNAQYLFKEISLDLLNTDESQNIDYTSYIEIPGNEDTSEYLRILIQDGTGTRALNYYQVQNTSVSKPGYKQFSIVNPKEGSQHLQCTIGEILGFSQIKNGNVFNKEELNAALDSSDGLQLENVQENTESVTMTTFKVSPTTGVFSEPKKLLSAGQTPLHEGAFSIELMFKTYGVADLEDKILTIGNITLCPKHIFINHEPDKTSEPHHTVNASRADFRKEVIQHVMITYDPNYKPSTYEQMYDKFFTSGSTTYSGSAKAYPCLKFYVNGTINRIISVGSSTICGERDFKFQIHPSNSNINMYIFRTYDKALSYEEVRKNYTSSMSKLADKQAYYLDNDILYLSTDYAAGQIASKSHLLNTISLGKCINKFRSVSNPNKLYTDRKVLLVALPEGILPPYYGNRKADEPKAAFLVHYPEVQTNDGYVPSEYSGVLNGGKVKAQGSSAKKYMIHNTSYSKFKFVKETEARKAKEENREASAVSYYKMPGSEIEIAKLVGKVNYASSMQSHKQGACKLFHEAYVDPNSGMNTSWMNGGRKAVLEDEFLYFFVNVPKDDLATITWDYFKDENGEYNFENCYFLGFQTWGSAKGDKPTSGYGKETPHYLMLEGADNDNPVANFKTPWASMQIWGNYKGGKNWTSADSTFIEAPSNSPTEGKNYYHQFAGGTQNAQTKLWTPDYLTGLLIKDETIVFDPGTESGTSSDKKADALDVDFGFTEGKGYVEKGKWYLDGEEVDKDTPGAIEAKTDNLFFVFEDKAIESVNRFAQFYNLVYTFDFSSLLYIPHGSTVDGLSMEINGKTSYQYKLVFGADCTITYGDTSVRPKAGDIYRWEKAWPGDVMANSVAKWVPGGLYHNGTNWESLNVSDICTWYCSAAQNTGTYPAEYAFFSKPEYESLKAVGANDNYQHIIDFYQFTGYDEDGTQMKTIRACMAEAFKIAMHEFLDIADISYHQAFIKLVAGTDNRAKNTYFQIVGPIYTDKFTSDINGEVKIIKATVKDAEGNDKKLNGYVKDNQIYEVTIVDEVVTETGEIYDATGVETKANYYKHTGKGDYKIRLYADDLDTIFKTDNNGQQVKPYYLLEPPFNLDMEELWGDMHSGLFYNYDLVFTEEVKAQLSKLLVFATANEWPDTHTTKFHDYFFSIQKNLPSIAYNHQSEIYYESAQVFWEDGKGTDFYKVFSDSGVSSWKDFTNNKVYDPVSLSHGSCLEAEIEYLRDRVLLLSTYTNTAKNQTDTSILLNGGSATTAGSEIVIASDYTSFIQYIYPIINNIESSKSVTGMDYDPILDYVNWDNTLGDYTKNQLVYNIAMPNEETTLYVKFASSGLTSNSYWTSTDLYRTINIKSGANAFSQLFNFPNASTVISQDPSYIIEISESKEVDVVDYLESIEHLVLQGADITSSGLNFTGCNRLKTLVLGKTEDNLTDSPDGTPNEDIEWYAVKFADVLDSSKQLKLNRGEASEGFQQVILPKSNSVEQVILPNCIKIANINYYPKLTRFEFNTGTQLTNLTIDGRNSNAIIEYILTNFVGTYTTNLEITNVPNNFWLTEATCRKLSQIANVKIEGAVYIGDGVNKATIDWSTKKLLVEKFGNIETGILKFEYTKVESPGNTQSVNTTGTIESSGLAPVTLTMTWNNVPIDTATNKNLKIHYSLIDLTTGKAPNSDDIKLQDKYTPYLIIKEGLKGKYKLTTRVYTSNSAYKDLETEITVGFYAPKPGDFAYANGTFSSIYDASQGVVGVVFYCNKTADTANNQNLYDVRVLSAEQSSTTDPMAPSSYALGFQLTNSQRMYQSSYKSLVEKLGFNYENDFVKDVVASRAGGSVNGALTYDTKWSGSVTDLANATLPNTTEHQNQKTYIDRANSYLFKLKNKPGITVSYLEADGWVKPTAEGKERFKQAITDLTSMLNLEAGGESFSPSSCGPAGFTYALYPAFLKALYYEPTPIVALSGNGETYFGLGNWYVPDDREMERLIYYRINSSISNSNTTELAWNNRAENVTFDPKTHKSNDVSGKGYNIFTEDAFNNISFLKDSNAQVTSVGTSDGEAYTYGVPYGYQTSPQWFTDCSEYSGTQSARDMAHNISPVCRIVLTEKL